ncbi:hypothetical protein [Candidatus Aalborgicola defluviihabitans]|uniref:hypothetical protein n=1 Tax=Candidatus Aalborgicola defluviihabitans TaxID=3386187 RepID=UPI001D6C0FA8|nr:hypothetical protein [Burkholderiales bacterium]MBK7280469.1 hypothetical protein [Burkholderiales bacterium]MBL0244665.1 hypothetical protein [Rhodoferax sp.]
MKFIALNPGHNATSMRRLVLAVTTIACAGVSSIAAAQSKLGSYTGTIEISGTQFGPEVTYRASVKVSLPVSQRSGSSIEAEFLSGEAPNATVLLSQWDISNTEKTKDSGGQFNSYTCSLAGPTEIPMSATGVLDVNLKEKKHTLSLTLVSTTDVAFNCKHSRSGPYKSKKGIALTLGTGAPGMQSETPLPFSDPSHLTAKYTLMPTAATKGEYGPINQVWDLKLK